MKAVLTALVAVAIPNVALAAPTSQFNLVCDGRIDPPLSTGAAYHDVYRIDLDHMRWCEADCRGTFAIADAKPLALVLQNSDSAGVLNFVDRETGQHKVYVSNPGTALRPKGRILYVREGHCEKAPFTGFPTFDTKF